VPGGLCLQCLLRLGLGADPELTGLARDCLAADRGDRPRDAGVVSARVSAHLQGVQQRLRVAELEWVEAQARAEGEAKRRELDDRLAGEALARADEERARRWLTVALAASVLSLALILTAAAPTRAGLLPDIRGLSFDAPFQGV
jgi:hypothetical protein